MSRFYRKIRKVEEEKELMSVEEEKELMSVEEKELMSVDAITYEWLDFIGGETNYTSHIRHFRKLFESAKIRGFLEWGCGFSSKYFSDHCQQVVSIEFEEAGGNWLVECQKMYAEIENWHGILTTSDADFMKVMEDFSPPDLDCVFVDCSPANLRGTLVELALSQNVPIVVAHDYNSYDEANCTVYAWDVIEDHSTTYTFFHCSYGSTGIWISNELADLVVAFTEYVKI